MREWKKKLVEEYEDETNDISDEVMNDSLKIMEKME